MRAVVQRVRRAAVRVADQTVAAIGPGLCVLLGVSTADGPEQARALAHKVAHLRIFGDEQGKLNRSVLDVGGSVLVVSQFTLYGDTSRGRRPSFVRAAPPERAEPLCEHFVTALRDCGLPVATGRFRATMLVEIHNDGPVTLVLDTDA
ncbi:MAG: D-tyrosyl-tRNA(Tyr) deacylase [Firmicutes bacterium]|jgi:D-tyrosyl-tRNA(Tyr) deacylase|nr:D-tyrosyl-tRNA(Tyr) deacylase [Bacillota bacterium]